MNNTILTKAERETVVSLFAQYDTMGICVCPETKTAIIERLQAEGIKRVKANRLYWFLHQIAEAVEYQKLNI